MKKKILIFTIILTTSIITSAQISGLYTIDKFHQNIDCNIYFYEDGNYFIELSEQVSSDIIESLVLSYGNYFINNNKIILTDKIHKFKMLLSKEGDKLKVINAFNLLLNKYFTIYNLHFYQEIPISSELTSLSIRKDRQNYKKSNLILFPLEYGLYGILNDYCIDIKSNNSYKIMYKTIIISEGTWKRTDNVLVLFDIKLNQSFYALIAKKVLISKLLPCDYFGYRLEKK